MIGFRDSASEWVCEIKVKKEIELWINLVGKKEYFKRKSFPKNQNHDNKSVTSITNSNQSRSTNTSSDSNQKMHVLNANIYLKVVKIESLFLLHSTWLLRTKKKNTEEISISIKIKLSKLKTKWMAQHYFRSFKNASKKEIVGKTGTTTKENKNVWKLIFERTFFLCLDVWIIQLFIFKTHETWTEIKHKKKRKKNIEKISSDIVSGNMVWAFQFDMCTWAKNLCNYTTIRYTIKLYI